MPSSGNVLVTKRRNYTFITPSSSRTVHNSSVAESCAVFFRPQSTLVRRQFTKAQDRLWPHCCFSSTPAAASFRFFSFHLACFFHLAASIRSAPPSLSASSWPSASSSPATKLPAEIARTTAAAPRSAETAPPRVGEQGPGATGASWSGGFKNEPAVLVNQIGLSEHNLRGARGGRGARERWDRGGGCECFHHDEPGPGGTISSCSCGKNV